MRPMPCRLRWVSHSTTFFGTLSPPRVAPMPPTGALPPPLTTKPRSAFVRLRAVTPPPHAPPASAAAWTALLAAAVRAAFGDADGARLAWRVVSTAAGERPGEAAAVVQVRAGEERRVWAAWRWGVGPSRRRWGGSLWGPAPACRWALLVGAPHSSHRAESGGVSGAAGR